MNRIAHLLPAEPAAVKRAREEGLQDGFERGREYEQLRLVPMLRQRYDEGYADATREADQRNQGLCWVAAGAGAVAGAFVASLVWSVL